MAGEGGAALKGLRLLTLDRGPEGYGFHMYTNKELKGQYVKWVSPEGPADLNGMLAGDHIIEVDGVNVLEMSHHEVVQRIRAGDGAGRTFLIIDQQTEQEMKKRNEPIISENAIVMIARSPSEKPPILSSSPPSAMDSFVEDVDSAVPGGMSPNYHEGQSPLQQQQQPIPEPSSSAGLNLNMQAARPQKKATKRAQVKQQDWRSAVKAYNAL